MSKLRKNLSLIATMLLVLAFILPASVSAKGNTFYSFEFDEKCVDKACSVYSSKNDNEQNWYLSIYQTNPNTSVSSTMSSTNIFLARMNKVGNVTGTDHHFVSGEHRISNYTGTGSSYCFSYVYLVDTDMTLYLGGRKTDDSTSTTPLIVCGYYCP